MELFDILAAVSNCFVIGVNLALGKKTLEQFITIRKLRKLENKYPGIFSLSYSFSDKKPIILTVEPGSNKLRVIECSNFEMLEKYLKTLKHFTKED